MRCAAMALIASALVLTGCQDQFSASGGGSRDQIKIVGSSTVYPFTTLVAERFVNKNPGMKAPVVEETGTGGGMKLFCGGIGAQFPDIEDASRRMTASEYKDCAAHGVTSIIEAQIGVDGIAFAQAKSGPSFALTPADLYLALAAFPKGKPNTAKTWKDVNPALPALPIQVYGPPSTSGTRDALAELILARGCAAVYPDSLTMAKKKPDDYKKDCLQIRGDGPYIDAGENDNLIVQKLQANPNAIGIFGYSYLDENKGTLNGLTISGVAPTYETISSGLYPGARPLYLYVKSAHMGAVPGMKQFLNEYIAAWGADGPLVKHGLIAAPKNVLDKSASILTYGTTMDPSQLN
ncbi:MAG: substrate-binding domain-containing protein [Sphingomonas sp.]